MCVSFREPRIFILDGPNFAEFLCIPYSSMMPSYCTFTNWLPTFLHAIPPCHSLLRILPHGFIQRSNYMSVSPPILNKLYPNTVCMSLISVASCFSLKCKTAINKHMYCLITLIVVLSHSP